MATILVIDDQDAVRTLLRTVLEGAGHEVTEAPMDASDSQPTESGLRTWSLPTYSCPR